MSRARPSRRGSRGVTPRLRAARARPCAAGNARCRMRWPPVRRTILSVCSLPTAESSLSWRNVFWMTAGWWSVSPRLPRPVSGISSLRTRRTWKNGINFRDKSEGRSGYALLHRFGSGKSVSVHHGRSKYMRLFLSRICQNTSCDDCHYRKLPRIADIILGDYWGISRYHPEMNDNKGTSVVLLNTEHGKALFESVADKVFQCDSKVEYAIAGNPCIVRSSKSHPKRSEFFASLDTYTLDQLIKKYCPFPSPLKRMYIRVRGILGRIKRKVVG